MKRLWFRRVAIVAALLLSPVILLVVAFAIALVRLDRPALADCGDERLVACDGVFEGPQGLDVRYRLLRPASGAQPNTLLVMFHGAGLTPGAQHWLSDGHLERLANEERVAVLLPGAGGAANGWRDGENPALHDEMGIVDQGPAVLALIDAVTKAEGIPAGEVVAAGYSNGGTMAMRLACEAPVPFKALATFGSPTSRTQIAAGCDVATPIVVFHGTEDHTNHFEGGHSQLFGFEVTMEGAEAPLSSPETVKFWRTVNGCDDSAHHSELDDTDPHDRTRSHRVLYDSCASQKPVAHVVIDGGGHYVPGDRPLPLAMRLLVGGHVPGDYSGYREALNFARAHALDIR